jgi:hypothetical protein
MDSISRLYLFAFEDLIKALTTGYTRWVIIAFNDPPKYTSKLRGLGPFETNINLPSPGKEIRKWKDTN